MAPASPSRTHCTHLQSLAGHASSQACSSHAKDSGGNESAQGPCSPMRVCIHAFAAAPSTEHNFYAHRSVIYSDTSDEMPPQSCSHVRRMHALRTMRTHVLYVPYTIFAGYSRQLIARGAQESRQQGYCCITYTTVDIIMFHIKRDLANLGHKEHALVPSMPLFPQG